MQYTTTSAEKHAVIVTYLVRHTFLVCNHVCNWP